MQLPAFFIRELARLGNIMAPLTGDHRVSQRVDARADDNPRETIVGPRGCRTDE